MENNCGMQYRQSKANLNLQDTNLHQSQQCNSIKNQLAYSKYLKALRNKKTSSSFTKYSKSLLMMEKDSFDLYQQQQETLAYQPHKLQIKWSCQEQENITDEILKASEEMDYFFSHNSLKSSKVEKNTKQNINCNQDQEYQRVQSELQFANEGIKCNLLPRPLQDRINFFISNHREKVNIYKIKSKPVSKTQGQIRFQVRNLSKFNQIFDKTQPKTLNEKLNESVLKRDARKQQNRRKSLAKFQLRLKGQRDLKDILQKYKKKLKKFSNKVEVGEIRQEGLFFNEFMKKARKYDSIDILSSIIPQKQRVSFSKQSIEPEETCEQNCSKLSNEELAKKCKDKFSHLNKFDLLKL